MNGLTRKQQDIFEFLLNNHKDFAYPPTLDEVCSALGLNSRGSLHKHHRQKSPPLSLNPLLPAGYSKSDQFYW
jgi:SOS-response transcriptional repressor LexA